MTDSSLVALYQTATLVADIGTFGVASIWQDDLHHHREDYSEVRPSSNRTDDDQGISSHTSSSSLSPLRLGKQEQRRRVSQQRERFCQRWYETELQELEEWLPRLNCEIPCPMSRPESLGCQTNSNVVLPRWCKEWFDWVEDPGCRFDSDNVCQFHVGAIGCIRSGAASSSGAGQQCCYGENGELIVDANEGAGTADRSWVGGDTFPYYRGVLGHFVKDVLPFQRCCSFFGPESIYCEQYFTVRPPNDGIATKC